MIINHNMSGTHTADGVNFVASTDMMEGWPKLHRALSEHQAKHAGNYRSRNCSSRVCSIILEDP